MAVPGQTPTAMAAPLRFLAALAPLALADAAATAAADAPHIMIVVADECVSDSRLQLRGPGRAL